MPKKRVFIALEVSPKLINKIAKTRDKLKELPVHWVDNTNLHITVIPPWYEENIENVSKELDTIQKRTDDFEVKFDKVSYGPGNAKPRLIWVEGNAPEDLLQLKDYLENILNKKPQRKKYLLHLTLARFEKEAFKDFPLKELNLEVNWKDDIKAVNLLESHISSKGSDYKILHSVPLL